MGTNWLNLHCSAKVSAPGVMPLEGAVSARRVTHAVYFPTCACARGSERVRVSGAQRSLWIHRDPLLTPQSIMCRCFCCGIGICACVSGRGRLWPPLNLPGSCVCVKCWAACIGWSTVRVHQKSDQILGESALQCPLKRAEPIRARGASISPSIPVLLLILWNSTLQTSAGTNLSVILLSKLEWF